MKGSVLKLLRENEQDFLSGEKISDVLGCSRTAVWKHIAALRDEGYQIEAVQNKGYQLQESGTALSEHDIYSRMHEQGLFRRVVYEESVTSTQTVARQLTNDGEEEGTVVVADEQTEGKGRLGRLWSSQKGNGIWMSLILKPDVDFRHASQLTLLTAVAVTRALEKETGLNISIKWPNDLLVDGKKICGILTEMQSDPDRILSVVIGLGINVNQHQFPDELAEKATSLSRESGQSCNRAELIAAVLDEFTRIYQLYLSEGFSFIKPMWESHAMSIGRHISARTAKDTIEGRALGINDDGVLLLEDAEGTVHHIHSADIEFK